MSDFLSKIYLPGSPNLPEDTGQNLKPKIPLSWFLNATRRLNNILQACLLKASTKTGCSAKNVLAKKKWMTKVSYLWSKINNKINKHIWIFQSLSNSGTLAPWPWPMLAEIAWNIARTLQTILWINTPRCLCFILKPATVFVLSFIPQICRLSTKRKRSYSEPPFSYRAKPSNNCFCSR